MTTPCRVQLLHCVCLLQLEDSVSAVVGFCTDLLSQRKTNNPDDPADDAAVADLSTADDDNAESLFLLCTLCQLYLDIASTGRYRPPCLHRPVPVSFTTDHF